MIEEKRLQIKEQNLMTGTARKIPEGKNPVSLEQPVENFTKKTMLLCLQLYFLCFIIGVSESEHKVKREVFGQMFKKPSILLTNTLVGLVLSLAALTFANLRSLKYPFILGGSESG